MGSDLSSNSLTRPVSSDFSETGDLRHEILPFDINYEPCQETEGLSIVESMPEIMSSQQSLGPNVRQQATAEVVASDSSEKEVEEINRCATNFDCNICFDIAKEPVVTSCGHLFCWPCLYLWLHVHSNHKECPVCKGEVAEAIITPIYGRGCSRSDNENKDEENSASGLVIPWRPRGNRLESRRQHFDRISRLANSLSLYQNYQMHNMTGFIGRYDVLMDEIFAGDPSILTSYMTERLEQGNTEDGPTTTEGRFQRGDESVLRDGGTESIPNEIDNGRGVYFIPAIDNFAAMNSVIGRAVGGYTENTNFCGPSSSVNSPNPGQFVSLPIVGARPSADQASASTAVAEVTSECSARDVLMDEILAGDPAILTSSMTRRLEQGNTEDGLTTVEGRFQRDDESVLRDGATESIPNEIDIGPGVYLIPAIYNLVAMNSVIERAVGRYTENSNFCGTSSSVNSPNPGQFVSVPIVGARPSADQASASTALTEIISECSARDVLMDEILAGDPAILTSSMTRRLEQGNTEDGLTIVQRRLQRDDESVPRDGATESIPYEIDTGRGLYLIPAIYNLVAMNSVIERAVGIYTENSNFCGTSSSVNSPNPGQFVSVPIVGARPSADQASASTALTEIINECTARDASAEPNSGESSSPSRRIRGSSSSSSSDDGGNRWTHKRIRLH